MTDNKKPGESVDGFDLANVHTDNLPRLLKSLGISLVFTSYQAGALVLVRSDGETLDLAFRGFDRPMGLAVSGDSLTLGTYHSVLEFRRHARLAASREPVGQVDACYVPRASLYTGMINIHDIAWGEAGLWVVNSTFSCLSTLTPDYSFIPRWQPPFIHSLGAEDRCHLNGMALREGRPAYVSTFSKFDRAGAWREASTFDGTLIDVVRNEILLDGLVMPHSPRWQRERLWFCESGHGLVSSLDPVSGQRTDLMELPGFTRGMAFFGPLMFVGLSRVHSSDIKKPAPISRLPETQAGIWVINLEDGSLVGHLRFTGDVDQIYDIAVIPDAAFPDLLTWDDEQAASAYVFPETPGAAPGSAPPH